MCGNYSQVWFLDGGEKKWLANFTGYYLLAGVLMVDVLQIYKCQGISNSTRIIVCLNLQLFFYVSESIHMWSGG